MYLRMPRRVGAYSANHSAVVGSSSVYVSALETEKTDSPLLILSTPVSWRYCSLMPRAFARLWPILVEVEREDIFAKLRRIG